MVIVSKEVKTRLFSKLWKPNEKNGILLRPCDKKKSCDDVFISDDDASKIVFTGSSGLEIEFDKKDVKILVGKDKPSCRYEGNVYKCTFNEMEDVSFRPLKKMDESYEIISEFDASELQLKSRPKVNMNEYTGASVIGGIGGAFAVFNPLALMATAPILMALWGGQLFGGSEVLDNNYRTKYHLPDGTDVHEIHLRPDAIESITFHQHPYLLKVDVKFKEPLKCTIGERPNKIRLEGHRRLDCGI